MLELETRIFFLCDGKKKACRGSEGCYWQNRGECMRTSDPRHARNFDLLTDEGLGKLCRSDTFEAKVFDGVIAFDEMLHPIVADRTVFENSFEGQTYDYPLTLKLGESDLLRKMVAEQLAEWEELDETR